MSYTGEKRRKKKPYIVRLMRKIRRVFNEWRRTNPSKARRLYVSVLAIIVVIVVGIFISANGGVNNIGNKFFGNKIAKKKSLTEAEKKASPKPSVKETISPTAENKVTEKPVVTKNPTKTKVVGTRKIYTFLQGPKSWKEKRSWSGYWGDTYMDGGYFGGFGCGLCCMANIYSTITPSAYKASPVDMYRFAKKNTGYWGGGAIDWNFMVVGMRKAGIHCGPRRKPKTYSAFRKDIAASECAVVLVSSYDSSCYWKHTPGHYVTIFEYDRKSDTIFLADSGDPTHNRRRVSLKKIYRSLKTASRYQYVKVKGYSKNRDKFKNPRARGKWIRPSYMRK